jgi:hypothetical protein
LYRLPSHGPAPRGRGLTDLASKKPAKVGLIGQPAAECNLGQGSIGHQHALRHGDTLFLHILL